MNGQNEVIHNEERYAKSTLATGVTIATASSAASSYKNYAASQQSAIKPSATENYNREA